MTPLPIDSILPDAIDAVRRSRALVLVAEPGAGKTTRVPPAILKAGLLDDAHPNVIMLPPRRVAARAVAERIADEQRWTLGREVGYHVRFDRKLTDTTRLRILTEGILTRRLLEDPFLDGIGCVVLDEFHERSIHADLAVALLKEVRAVRPDLLLVVMSATLDAEPIARYLDDAPILRAQGRTFPVSVGYSIPSTAPLHERAAAAVANHPSDADALVFLPGVGEIERTIDALKPLADRNGWQLVPLHGSLPAERQLHALAPSPRRKIICSTNIAETSLTIDGVNLVIDSGLERLSGFDAQRGMDRLDLVPISRASADQRAGRAGRTASGDCVRLYTVQQYHAFDAHHPAELQRVDLCQTVLMLHAWGRAELRGFQWFEAPPESSLQSAERLLVMLGALTPDAARITPLGERLLALPIHPRLGRLLLASAEQGLLEQGALMAALLSERDILLSRRADRNAIATTTQQGQSDLLHRMELFAHAERSRFANYLRDQEIDPAAARQVARVRDELLRLGKILAGGRSEKLSGDEDAILRRILLSAYPDRLVRRRGEDHMAGLMVGGVGIRLDGQSIVHEGEFFLALDPRADSRAMRRESFVRIASRVELEWIEADLPHLLQAEKKIAFDDTRQRVVARATLRYLDLILKESADAPVAAADAREALQEVIRSQAAQLFRDDEQAAQVLRRIELLRRHMSEHPWPTFDAAHLGDMLAGASASFTSMAQVKKLALDQLVMAELPYPLDRLLEREAPQTITVPTGNRLKVDYSGERPVLAVRLQEMFGQPATPRIAGGRCPVVLHLLGPNYRPVQITDDLGSFWKNTYVQVRKDLRARYPKHAWPDDPTTAAPQAKGRPTR